MYVIKKGRKNLMRKGIISKKAIIFGIMMLFVGASVLLQTQTIVKADLTNGLIGYWSFNDGTATDQSGNGNHGTVYGATEVSGKSGNAFQFDGDDDYIDIGDNPDFDITGNLTISLWFKTNTSQLGTFVSKLDPQNLDNGYNLVMGDIVNTYPPTSAGTIYFMMAKDSTSLSQYDIAQTTSTFTDNVWHHLTAFYRPDGISRPKIYIDAIEQSVSNSGVPLSSIGASAGYPLKFAEYSYGSGYHNFNGILDEIRIYNRALIEDEIQELAGIIANQPPVADAGGPYYANVNNAITFSGSGSSDIDGTIIGYRWDFTNDETYDTEWLSSATTTHSYSSVGIYTVKLEVKDNDGASNTDTATATITSEGGAIPTAKANGPYSGYVNHPVSFSSAGSVGGSDGTIVSWYWTFGDETVSSQQHQTHTYTSSGTFTVTLKVTNNYGQTDTDTTTATISDISSDQSPPIANAGGPYKGVTGTPISFNGSGSSDADGTLVSYVWNFGDSTTGTGVSPTHTYTIPGNYTVVLTVTDNDSLTHSNSTIASINVSGPPTIVIFIDISNIEPIEEENEKTIPVTVFCYHQAVSNIHLEILESSNLTVTLLSPNITLNPGESKELLIKIKAPKLKETNNSQNTVGDETIILRAFGDNNVTSNTEQINLKIIEENATPGFEAIATFAAVGSAGALVTFFRRRNRNR